MPGENAVSCARARDLIQPTEFVEHPMLFSAAMVRAILAGSKRQTRRCVVPRNSLVNGAGPCMRSDPEIISAWPNLDFTKAWIDPGPSPLGNPGPYLKVPGGDDSVQRVYSRIQPGDELWVRETWRAVEEKKTFIDGVLFQADDSFAPIESSAAAAEQWVDAYDNGRHGASWRPSIFMPRWASRITLKVTEVRAQRLQDISAADALSEGVEGPCILDNFERLWDSINGKRESCSWDCNPWVWALTFKRVT